jgi:HEAT repeat protein
MGSWFTGRLVLWGSVTLLAPVSVPVPVLGQATQPVANAELRQTIETLREDMNPVNRFAAVTKLRDGAVDLSDADAAVVSGVLLRALEDPSPAVSRTAAEGLIALGPAAAAELIEGLKHDSPNVRAACAALLYRLGEGLPKAAVDSLLEALRHRSPQVRIAALLAAEGLTVDKAKVIPAVAALMDDADPNVARLALDVVNVIRFGAPARVGQPEVPWQVGAAVDPRWFVMRMLTGPRAGAGEFRMPGAETVKLLRDAKIEQRVESVARERDPAAAGAGLDDLIGRLSEEQMTLLAPWLAEARKAVDDALAGGRFAAAPDAWALIDDVREQTHRIRDARARAEAEAAVAVMKVVERQNHAREAMRLRQERAEAGGRLLHYGLNLFRYWGRGVGAGLGRVGEAAADVPMRAASLVALVRQSVRKNMALLEGGSAGERREAIVRLTLLSPFAAPALPLVRAALKDEDSQVRYLAAVALGTPDARRAAELGDWVEALADADAAARVMAAVKLREMRFDDAGKMRAVAAAMARPDWLSRAGLAAAAQRAWREDSTIGAQLDRMAKDGNDELERLCARAGLKILAAKIERDEKGDGSYLASAIAEERAAAIKLLSGRIAGDDARRALASLRLLRELIFDLAPAKDALAKAAISTDKDLRREATEGLVWLGERGVEPLLALLRQGDPEAQGLALAQLGRMGPAAKSAVPVVKRFLSRSIEPPNFFANLPSARGWRWGSSAPGPTPSRSKRRCDRRRRTTRWPRIGRTRRRRFGRSGRASEEWGAAAACFGKPLSGGGRYGR